MLAILMGLAPLATDLTPIILAAIATVKSQTGKTDQEILAEVSPLLATEDAALVADIIARGGTAA